jgi:hypothetical protein
VLSWALDPINAVLLRSRSGERIGFRASQNFRVVRASDSRGPWKVSIAAYYYSIEAAEGQELVQYHWHPEDTGRIDYPHLHLGSGAQVKRSDVTSAHIRTGRVSLENVLEMLIEDFGVRPRRKDDWRSTLRKAHGKFRDFRTWS